MFNEDRHMGREVCRRLRATDERLFAVEMSAEPQTTSLEAVKTRLR